MPVAAVAAAIQAARPHHDAVDPVLLNTLVAGTTSPAQIPSTPSTPRSPLVVPAPTQAGHLLVEGFAGVITKKNRDGTEIQQDITVHGVQCAPQLEAMQAASLPVDPHLQASSTSWPGSGHVQRGRSRQTD